MQRKYAAKLIVKDKTTNNLAYNALYKTNCILLQF